MSVSKKPMQVLTEKNSLSKLAMPCVAAIFCVAVLSGCGDKGKKANTQVAAKVNDEEITIYQVNSQLARSGITGDVAIREASKKILDALIDQQLLAQQSKRKKLDRDPAVMQAIEDAKRQILVQAYLERDVYAKNSPTPAEGKAFYESHPELFAKRKAYKFHVFEISKDKFSDKLKSALENVKTSAEASAVLKSQAVDFKEDEIKWLAEQVPMDALPAIAKMKIGDIAPLEKEGRTALLLLEGISDNPIDEAQAQPVIEKYITNLKNKESLDAKLKQLRSGEQITYVGQFAETQPAADKPAQEAKEPQAPQPAKSEDFMKKGLQGLK